MAQSYPKTFPGYNFPSIPANDNRPGGFPYVGHPVNDNRVRGRSLVPAIRSGLRRMRFADARAQLVLDGMSLVFDMLSRDFPWEDTIPFETDPIAAGVDWTGWTRVQNIRVPSFNVPGVSSMGTSAPWPWPNITKAWSLNYSGALAGFGGNQVPEFFVLPVPTDNAVSTWFYNSGPSGTGYWRVSSAERWQRDVGNTKPVPQWHPASPGVPYFVPILTPSSKPMWRVRQDSRVQEDIHGVPLRGPVTRALPRARPDERPRPPGPGEKETKWHGKVIAILAAVAEGVTEVKDFVECIYDALPAGLRARLGLRGGYADLELKVDALYRYWGQVDVGQALQNLVYNGMEDAVAGRVYGAISRARSNLGVVTGPVVHGVSVTV